MKIRMKVTSAGPDGVLNEGKVYDVDDARAKGLVAGGYATEEAAAPPVEAPAPEATAEVEEATVEAPETATAPAQRRSPSNRGARRG